MILTLNKGTDVFLIVVLVVLATRLPFIQYGYGNDADAWDVASTAQTIGTTGQYRMSRPPGHPLQEIVCAALWQYGPTGLNGVTGLLSALGAGCFALSLRALGVRNPIVGGLALALTPVVWIHSTDLTDYVWALAFLLASLHAILSRRTVLAGIFLALAISCRATSVALVLPLSVILFLYDRSIKRTILFGLSSCLFGALAYVPAAQVHGDHVLTVWTHGYPRLHTVLYMLSVGVWGLIGAIAIGSALTHRIARRREEPLSSCGNAPVLIGSLCAVLICVIIFLLLPHESGYLIPMVPFTILLLSCVLKQKIFDVICVCLISSSLLFGFHQKERIAGATLDSPLSFTFTLRGIELVLDIMNGPVLYDAAVRRETMHMVDRVIEASRVETRKVAFVAGGLMRQVQSRGWGSSGNVVFTTILDEESSRRFVEEGYDIYYLQDVFKRYNMARNGLDLDRIGARFVGEYPPLQESDASTGGTHR